MYACIQHSLVFYANNSNNGTEHLIANYCKASENYSYIVNSVTTCSLVILSNK